MEIDEGLNELSQERAVRLKYELLISKVKDLIDKYKVHNKKMMVKFT